MIDAAHPAIRAVNDAQVVLTPRPVTVEVFEHGWGDSPSHSMGSQGIILEVIRGARLGRGESTGEDGGVDLETADTAKGWPKGG